MLPLLTLSVPHLYCWTLVFSRLSLSSRPKHFRFRAGFAEVSATRPAFPQAIRENRRLLSVAAMGGRESSGAGGRLAQRHEAASFSTLSHSYFSTYLDCCQEKYATQGGYDSPRRKGHGTYAVPLGLSTLTPCANPHRWKAR